MFKKTNPLYELWVVISTLLMTFALGFLGANNASAQPSSCVLIDNDYDIDDMMAIPLVIGNKYVAAIIQSEGYTFPEQGAAAIEQLVNRLPDQVDQRKIPIIVGGKQGIHGRDLDPKWNWIPFFRAMMNVSNGLLPNLPAPKSTDLNYVQKVVDSVTECKKVSILVIGTYTSFIHYIDLIRDKVDRVVIMGQPIGDESATPGRESFNCNYDFAACQTAMTKLEGLQAYFVDIPRFEDLCHHNPLHPDCYSPSYEMVAGGGESAGLISDGLPGRLKQALLNNTPCDWPAGANMPNVKDTVCSSQSTWVPEVVKKGPGGEMLFWDQSAALFLLYPELFSLFYPPENPSLGGKHYEPTLLNNSHAQTIQRLRKLWTQETNKSVKYIVQPN